MPRDVGSDFEPAADRWLRSPTSPPWERLGEPITYLESGRQALRLVAKELGRAGYRRVALPEHHCESMTQAFRNEDWDVLALPVDNRLQVLPDQHRALQGSAGTVVLHAPYFGYVETTEELHALETLESSGVPVIVDETHRTTTPTRHAGRIRIASLRKLLPVPDGAYVSGIDIDRGAVGPPTGAAELRMRAMSRKRAYLSGETDGREHRQLYLAAEELTEKSTLPAAMSDATHSLVRTFDYPSMSRRRVQNAQVLVEATSSDEVEVAVPLDGIVPSHLVLSGNAVPGLRRHLATNRVFCPYHWPRPVDVEGPWRHDLMSVPVDHRYNSDDMFRVGALISEFRPDPDER